MKTKKQKARERRFAAEMQQRREMRIELDAERARLAAGGPARLSAILGWMPSANIMAAAILRLAEEAYHAEVVTPQMEDMIDETREGWIATWVHATIEDVTPSEEAALVATPGT